MLPGVLLGALLSATALIGTPASSTATVSTSADGTDVLYVRPAASLDVPGLGDRLGAMGLDVIDSAHDEGARVRVPAGADAASVAARIAGSGVASSVETDGVVRASRVPDDPLYVGGPATYLDAVGAEDAWSVETGNDSIVIAIVDTGIDYSHPDLRNRLVENRAERFDGRDNDRNGCIDDFSGCTFVSLATADPSCGYRYGPPNWRASDDEGHGTFVAGLAAAAGDNGTGITGIAWNARLLSVKVLDCTATGRISDAAAGIRYAANNGADVINISFGTLTDSPALHDAIDYAMEQGSIIVASAGNDGRRGLTYPARYDGVISVAASGLLRFDGYDYRATATFANFGRRADVLAPGVNLISTVPERLCGVNSWICLDGPYAIATGSSFATPIVAGAVALARARYPDLAPTFIVQLIMATRTRGATFADSPVLDIAAAVGSPKRR